MRKSIQAVQEGYLMGELLKSKVDSFLRNQVVPDIKEYKEFKALKGIAVPVEVKANYYKGDFAETSEAYISIGGEDTYYVSGKHESIYYIKGVPNKEKISPRTHICEFPTGVTTRFWGNPDQKPIDRSAWENRSKK